MGTNYYLHEKQPCSECGRGYEPLHIGKSSAGWVFALHVIPDKGLNSLDDWIKRWSAPNARIEDEYGDELCADEMLSCITERSWTRQEKPYGYLDWTAFHAQNESYFGPNGLLRSRRTKPGEGTWDLVEGEFS